jgi:hypothetical protein
MIRHLARYLNGDGYHESSYPGTSKQSSARFRLLQKNLDRRADPTRGGTGGGPGLVNAAARGQTGAAQGTYGGSPRLRRY